jgi:lipase
MVLHVYEWGDAGAPPVVCLHGVRAHGLRYRRLAERLAGRRRVIALDLRGHGHSDWEPPWDVDTHVDDVLETVDALGIEQAAWVGHSFGGRLVLELAARVPDRMERAVLLDPAVWVPPPIAQQRAEEERVERSFATVAEAIERRREGVPLAPDEFLEEEMEAHLVLHEDGRYRLRYSQSAVVAAFGEMAKPPPLEAACRVPTLMVRAPGGQVAVDAIVDMCRAAYGELLEVVDVDGGHTVMWDAFDETARAVEEFL